MKMNKDETRYALGRIIRMRREEAGFSRDELSKLIHVSRSTLERMENGTAPIEFSDFMNICDVCRVNAAHDFFLLSNPELMQRLPFVLESRGLPSSSPAYQKAWRDAYSVLCGIAQSCNLVELLSLSYLLSGEAGGDRYALLQKHLADAQCNVGDRESTCALIISNYEDALNIGDLPEHVLDVDLDYLKDAHRRGREAYRKGERTYL